MTTRYRAWVACSIHRPARGRAALFGIDAWADPVEAHRRVGYVSGEPFLWPGMTGGETIEFLARLRGGTDRAYRDELVRRFDLDTNKKVRALSKGNRAGQPGALAGGDLHAPLRRPCRPLTSRCAIGAKPCWPGGLAGVITARRR
ncbi:MAG TPA: hypothetical protein VIV12_07605, partial [Streptosporangiaceae bacterium]